MFSTAAHEFTIKTLSTSLNHSLKKIADRLGSKEDDDERDEEEEYEEEEEEEEDDEQGKKKNKKSKKNKTLHSPDPEESAKKQ